MRFDVITLFPEVLEAVRMNRIWEKAEENKLLSAQFHQLRDFAEDKHNTVDDTPYGGGEGMVLKVDVLVKALESVDRMKSSRVLFASPQGPTLNQEKVLELSRDYSQLIVVSGRYEGVDERFVEGFVDEMFSVGDYVLSSGDLPAMVLMEAVARVIPGVLGNQDSVSKDSFSGGILKYPQYTRPEHFRGLRVPDVLKAGNHRAIDKWRRSMAKKNTLQRRPDLMQDGGEKEPETT